MTDAWRHSTLGEMCRIQIGRTPPRKEARYWTQDLERPFCTIADMADRHINPSREGVTQAAESEGRAKRVPAGALLMSFKLTIGRVGFAGRDLFPNEAIAWLSSTDPALNEEFLALWLEAQDLSQGSGRAVKGATLNSDSLRAIPVSVPPLEVQRRIVDLIGALDAQSDRLRSEADSLRTLLASVHRRLDEAPEWRQLREFANADGIQIGPFGSQLHASDYVDEGLAVVMPQDMVGGTISDARIKRVAPGQADRLARHVLQEGDILFARRGDLTKRAWVGPEHAGGLCGTGSIRFRPRRAAMAPALFEALSTERASSWLLEHAVGTTMPNLNTQIISALPVPDLDENGEGSAAAAAGIRRHLMLLSREEDATSELRTVLLNDLLSREVKLPEASDRLRDAGVA